MKILIAGGAGFIGSTVASACLDAGHQPIILDDLSTGRREYVRGRPFVHAQIGDRDALEQAFTDHSDIVAAIDLAAYIDVPASSSDPARYYENNVSQSLAFIRHLAQFGCHRVVFSSSASVYGPSADFGVDEQSELDPKSPYARTKLMCEWMLEDIAKAGAISAIALRYFNPIGADPKLRTGPQSANPSHVLGKIIQAGQSGGAFTITGTDWPTPDGTGLRDYVHVWDIATAHVAAVERFDSINATNGPFVVINLGSGQPCTVRQLISAYESVAGAELKVIDGPRRAGDSIGSYTRSRRAKDLLGWRPEHTLATGIRDSLRWAERRRDVLEADPNRPRRDITREPT